MQRKPQFHTRHLSRRLSRRMFLRTTAGLSLGAFASRYGSRAVHAQDDTSSRHGTPPRGLLLTAKDRSVEGRFGLMFKQLPAFTPPDSLLVELGTRMMEEQPPGTPDEAHLNTSPVLFAGFTFFGQFIDHDITFDNTPLETQQLDPDARVNFRTPRYDLDSVYGRGPAAEPQFYDPNDLAKLRLEHNIHGVEDLPRTPDGRAIIPEARNDENLIIAQLHIGLIKFHNALVDSVRSQGMRPEWVFDTARRLTRWHYQWLVIHDVLPRFVGSSLIGPTGTVYREQPGKPPRITLTSYKPTNRENRPFMPVEFAVAAYRFGHSIVRPVYIINEATAGGVPIFGLEPGFNLNGGRPIPPDLVVKWKNILEVDPAFPPRKPRKIDTKLSLPLFSLPDSVIPPPDPQRLLAVRNNLRGKQVGLPSGQQVAKAMRAPVLTNAQLGLGSDPGWKGEAPLWYYVLKEAELAPTNGERLGAVGGRIVAEVLVGLLQRDMSSYLYLDPAWKPAPPIAPATGQFTLVDLLRFAGVA